MKTVFRCFLLGFLLFTFSQCKKEPASSSISPPVSTSPYVFEIPKGFSTDLLIPDNNPTTVEGIALGKKLFYDPILSGDNTQSCGSCHSQAFNFSDNNKAFSEGIDGIQGGRNAPTIVNVLWAPSLYWDGRAATLEDQALGPVPNPVEMHLEWENAVVKLAASSVYPALFEQVFKTKNITKEMVVQAIAQFERTFISANSRYDQYLNNNGSLSDSELRGDSLFFSEKTECFHCHGTVLFTDHLFRNNGLDETPTDLGLGEITKNPKDNGKFKTPTLRNIASSGPYMHDGRFSTLEEVVEFYSTGVKFSATIDPLMVNARNGGIQLTTQEKADLVAFMKTLTDTEFLTNPDFAEN